MKTLFESLKIGFIVIDTLEDGFLNIDMFNSPKKYLAIVDKYSNQFKEDSIKNFGEWMKNNPTRRNISAETEFSVNISLRGVEDNKLLDDVIREMNRIGVVDFDFEPDFSIKYAGNKERARYLNYGENYYKKTLSIYCSTYKQFKDDKCNVQIEVKETAPVFKESKSDNSYNKLPAKDIDVVRKKLYGCIKGFNYEVYKEETTLKDSRKPNLPKYRVILEAQYDNTKLKKMLDDIKSDRYLQRYANSMDSISREISKYYGSKRSGDYSGD